MKKIIFCLFLLVLTAGFVSTQQRASPPPEVTIINNTGYPIYEIYMTPDFDDYWGDDWLNGRTIRNGESVTLTMEYTLSEANIYDICLVDTDDDTYTKMGVNITQVSSRRIEFTFDDFDYNN